MLHLSTHQDSTTIMQAEQAVVQEPSKEYLQVWFDPPRDGSISCLTTKGMRTIGAVCA
ncbi:hypothetical protein Tco_0342830, partial [Tanacetum coccineum]